MPFGTPWTKECEEAINKQIAAELSASITYEAAAAYCLKHDVALEGFAKHYREEAEDERSHARMFIDYQLQRGGEVKIEGVHLLVEPKWASILDVVKDTLRIEQNVQKMIMALTDLSMMQKDYALEDFLEFFNKHQEKEVYKLTQRITKLERVGSGHGLHQLDREIDS